MYCSAQVYPTHDKKSLWDDNTRRVVLKIANVSPYTSRNFDVRYTALFFVENTIFPPLSIKKSTSFATFAFE